MPPSHVLPPLDRERFFDEAMQLGEALGLEGATHDAYEQIVMEGYQRFDAIPATHEVTRYRTRSPTGSMTTELTLQETGRFGQSIALVRVLLRPDDPVGKVGWKGRLDPVGVHLVAATTAVLDLAVAETTFQVMARAYSAR